jgi:hypothetical protein
MLISIINNCSRSTKTSKDSVSQKLNHNSTAIGHACNSLHPFGHIVHGNKNVQITEGVWEWSHEINAPHIENLNNKNGFERHHILF